MMRIKFKHIFFLSRTENFSSLFIDSLIGKVGVNPESLCIVRYGDSSNGNVVDMIEGVTCLDLEDVEDSLFINSTTITYFSLNSYNSKYIRSLLSIAPEIGDKAYMFLTDDEVERWIKCKEKYGILTSDDKLSISDDDIWVLKRQKGFFGLDKIFREKLNSSIGQQDRIFVDITSVFDMLPTLPSEHLFSAISHSRTVSKTILLGTKPSAFKYKDLKCLIQEFVKFGLHKEFKFIIMWPVTQWRKRVLLELYFLYLHKIKKITLDVSILTSLSPLAYNAVVSSCSHLLLQSRGGGGAARLFLKLGLGKVCSVRGGHNGRFFKEGQSIELLEYSTFRELVENLKRDVDIPNNALKINEEEQRSIKELAKFYS
ncbi:TM1812 family CRISPR-associated protein [Vibrio splendidus]|uniref:TM1812 family CRISPR-associated protein n=1 Tax=Vibrio splendidus TaxID=29497 RepID=UPI0024693894|nr:TM1812 family CRISPR-associated protein [Vibrio splendidus]MDH6027898.1 hypothetical protein [Vibrio splendidus]